MRPCLPFLVVISGCVAAEAAPRAPLVPESTGPTATAPKTLFLRNAFDTDPSLYLGRFIPDGTPLDHIDESRGMQT
jgi:hypothetical protein